MKHLFPLTLALCSLVFLSSCHNNAKKAENAKKDSTAGKDSTAMSGGTNGMLGEQINGQSGDVQLFYFKGSPDYPDAQLKLKEMPKSLKKGEKASFEYEVKNYELTQQTAGHEACNCNNSSKGQHIHLILNNKPYKALYKPEFDTALKPGHYLAVSFLSRSFHESVKNKNAYQVEQFNVLDKKGNDKGKEKEVDVSKPMLVYSRPKGEYSGKDAENVLLDFYLLNTDLSEAGNKVVATVNGQKFTLTKWTGYAIKGLKEGKNTIKLQLVNKDGKTIPGPYNSVERKITIKK